MELASEGMSVKAREELGTCQARQSGWIDPGDPQLPYQVALVSNPQNHGTSYVCGSWLSLLNGSVGLSNNKMKTLSQPNKELENFMVRLSLVDYES